MVIGIIGFLVGAGIGAGIAILLWSTEILPVLSCSLGGGFIAALLLVGFKYCMSSIENRGLVRKESVKQVRI